MAGAQKFILYGPCAVSIADWAANGAGTPFVDVGYTAGPVVITFKPTDYDVKVQQIPGILDKFVVDSECSAKFTMAELSIPNLRRAFRQPAANQTGTGDNLTLYVGVPDSQKLTIKLVGVGAGTTKVQTITLNRCIVTEPGAWDLDKEKPGQLETTVAVLYDESMTGTPPVGNDKYFKIVNT